ncbi:hypothetical protein SDC9_146349 [bioreactor metagenome]|uniref:Uncharacterized protein n=1 Tax=bioreactor metagenome TaxID=1076179 RepID=A0A645EDG8_9ZZZZ
MLRMTHEPAVEDQLDRLSGVAVELFPVQEKIDLRQVLRGGHTLDIIADIEVFPFGFVSENRVFHGHPAALRTENTTNREPGVNPGVRGLSLGKKQ